MCIINDFESDSEGNSHAKKFKKKTVMFFIKNIHLCSMILDNKNVGSNETVIPAGYEEERTIHELKDIGCD